MLRLHPFTTALSNPSLPSIVNGIKSLISVSGNAVLPKMPQKSSATSVIQYPKSADMESQPYLVLQLSYDPENPSSSAWGTAHRSFHLSYSGIENQALPDGIDDVIMATMDDLAKLSTRRGWQVKDALEDGKSMNYKTDMRETLKAGTEVLKVHADPAGLGSWGIKTICSAPSVVPTGRWFGAKDDPAAGFETIKSSTAGFSSFTPMFEAVKEGRENRTSWLPRVRKAGASTPSDPEKASRCALSEYDAEKDFALSFIRPNLYGDPRHMDEDTEEDLSRRSFSHSI